MDENLKTKRLTTFEQPRSSETFIFSSYYMYCFRTRVINLKFTKLDNAIKGQMKSPPQFMAKRLSGKIQNILGEKYRGHAFAEN